MATPQRASAAEPLQTTIEHSCVPLGPDAEFRRVVVGSGAEERPTGKSVPQAARVVYSNRLGNGVYAPGGAAGALVGDDFAALVSGGCVLDSLRFRVSGDPLANGSGTGPFSVTFAFYSGCPSAGGFPLFAPVTQQFVDNGNYEVVFRPDQATEIAIPTNAYFGVTFSRSLAGIVAGGLPTIGFSADLYDFPQGRCDVNFGGFPDFDHASFDLEITARDDCAGGMCSSTCSGGSNDGGFCLQDDCPGASCVPDVACLGGPNNGAQCSTDADCSSVCVGGGNDGNPCTPNYWYYDCPRGCLGGPMVDELCYNDDGCPESTCSFGTCPEALCTRDQCDGGVNIGGMCFVDDCPSGSCDGPAKCDGGTNADQACTYDCLAAFPAYKNSLQGGQPFTSRPVDDYFADEIRLSFPADKNNPCLLTSWEVGFKGRINGTGAVQAELHTFLDADNPEIGGRIPGTRVADQISGNTVKTFKKTFATPIPITQQNLFVVFKTSNDLVGAIRTCKEAALGSTQDVYFVHSGDEGGTWQLRGFEAGCIAAFEVTLSCEGAPAAGACCDMTLTEGRTCIGGTRDGLTCNGDSQCRVCIGGSNEGLRCDQTTDCPGGFCPPDGEAFCIGDAVCRNLPEMNCAYPTLWREGESCGARCDGGAFDGESCASPFDCPPACAGGGRDGEACFTAGDCPGVCEEGSARAGVVCLTDSQCRVSSGDTSLCVDFGTCGAPGVCRGQFCVGGPNHGVVCSRAIDCPDGECGSSCLGGDNDGLPCLQTSDCPIGSCPATPFPEPCGLGKCCTSNMLRCCVTERECHTEGTPCGLADEPLETPVRYTVGSGCAAGSCPRRACVGQDGDCTQEREGVCVGGLHNGEACVFNDPCFFDPCCQAGGVCEGQPGCGDQSCCSYVCDMNPTCCSNHWSQSCANATFGAWQCYHHPVPNDCRNAEFLPLGALAAIELQYGGSAQPGFCCYHQEFPGGPGPGSRAEAVTWFKTIAPASGTCRGGTSDGATCTADEDCDSGKCRAYLSVDTCPSASDAICDFLVQVFSVDDLDTGLCQDGSICSVSAQDCINESECVLDEWTLCDSLSPIGCQDGEFSKSCFGPGQASSPFLSGMCVDVVPGDPYYILVGAKDKDVSEPCHIRASEFCTPTPPPLFNDLCVDAVPLGANGSGCDSEGNCDEVFDLAGFGGAFAPATFDCPGPGCLNTMELDVWYDWTAPATGRVSAETCDGTNTPDTSLVLYDGCDCPVSFGTELACSEYVLDSDCFLGSRVSAAVTGGRCYKFRLGGHFTQTPSGTLDIDFEPCPPGPITAIDPPDWTIDGRAPLDPFTNSPLGIDSFTVRWVGGSTDMACYSYCETNVDGFAPNDIFGFVTDHGDDTFTVNLARPIAPGAFGKLTVKHGDDSTSHTFVATQPGDANADGIATSPADLDFLVAGLNGLVPFNKYRHDMDHSGALTPHDLLRWIDVTSGVSGAFDPWLNAPFPDCAPCCPFNKPASPVNATDFTK